MIRSLLGFLIMIAGGLGAAYMVEHPPLATGLIYTFIGVAIFGAVCIDPDPILGTAKNVIVIVLPLIPWSKAQDAAKRLSGQVPTPPDGDK